MNLGVKSLLCSALVSILGLGAVDCVAQPENTTSAQTPSPHASWEWMHRFGSKQAGHNRYINMATLRKEDGLIKYSLKIESVFNKSEPEFREVAVDCTARTRGELDPSAVFRAEDMKTYYPGTDIGKESRFACDELDPNVKKKKRRAAIDAPTN